MVQSFKILFVLLLLCYALCVSVYASGPTLTDEVVNEQLFELGKKVQVQGLTGDIKNDVSFSKINLPVSFSAKSGVMVAVAKAAYTEGVSTSEGKVGVVAKFIETNGIDNWNKDTINDAIVKGKMRLVTEYNNDGENVFFTVTAPIVNADKNKIYMLLVSINGQDSTQQWDFKLLEGTVSGEEKKLIEWAKKSLTTLKDDDFKKQLKEYTIKSFVVDGSVFLKENKKILFVVKGVCENDGSKKVTLLFQFDETGNKLELLHHESTEGLHSTFFYWNGEILKTPIKEAESGSNKIMVFNTGKQETQTNSPIVRLRDFLKGKNNFVNATIEENSVLLFTQLKPNATKNDVHLWMTDGTRVGYGGIITAFEKTKTFYGPVLHTNNKFFALHQTIEAGQEEYNKIYFTLLDKKLETMTNIVKAWKQNDNDITQFYKDGATKKTLTDGLVGYLSALNGNQIWKDKYLNMDATLYGEEATKQAVGNGFKFSGNKAGAKWPIKNKQQEEPYSFINSGFTLVATVKIGNGTNGKGNSILGLGLTGDTNNVGLFCTNDGNWDVKYKSGQKKEQQPKVACKYDKPYYVAFILNNTKISVYVNGEKLPEFYEQQIQISGLQSIQNFYFGADSGTDELAATDVTITNVLLYNRPFTEEEVKQLKPKQEDETDNQAISQSNGSTLPRNKETTDKTGTQPDTSVTQTTTEKEDNQSSSPPPTTEDSAVRVGVVGVLCFMLFGAFTLLGRYVY